MHGSGITGIILAGGKSKRFGQNKALFELRGIRLIDRVVQTMSEICDSLLISSGESLVPISNVTHVTDIESGKGPMMGIYSALLQSNTEHNFVISVDTPLVPSALFTFLYQRRKTENVIVPVYANGYFEPLIGYYNKDILPVMKRFIDANDLKMIHFFSAVPFLGVDLEKEWPDWDKNYLINLNTPEDLQAFYTAGLTL